MDENKLHECPLAGGDIPGMREAKTDEEKLLVLEQYYWTLEEMAKDAQSAIDNRIKHYKKLLETNKDK